MEVVGISTTESSSSASRVGIIRTGIIWMGSAGSCGISITDSSLDSLHGAVGVSESSSGGTFSIEDSGSHYYAAMIRGWVFGEHL